MDPTKVRDHRSLFIHRPDISTLTVDTMLRVTADSSANKRILRRLVGRYLIEVFDVNIENFSKNTEKVPAVAVWGHSKWNDGSVWGSDDGTFDEVAKILGKHNMGDIRHLEAHIRSGNDIFVTEDLDEFIRDGRREKLEQTFSGLKIMTSDELVNHLV